MTDSYYHGYLSQDSRGRYTLGAFVRVHLGGSRFAYGEYGDYVEPILVLLPHGLALAGATMGASMAACVCLDVLDIGRGYPGSMAWRDAMRDAWYMADQEAELWARHLAEEGEIENMIDDDFDGYMPGVGYIPAHGDAP